MRRRRRKRRRRRGEKAPTHSTTRNSKGTNRKRKKQARKQQGSHQWLPKTATGLKDWIEWRGRREEQRGHCVCARFRGGVYLY